MWHRKKRRRLGVKTKHRKALLRNLVRGLALHREIETTHARAKEASRIADQMVTIAKAGTLAARRNLIRRLGSSEVARLFIEEIAPRLQDRNGGYTRVLKLGSRVGDGAERALLQFSVPIEVVEKKEAKPKKEKKPKAPPSEKPSKLEKPKAEKAKPEPPKKGEKEETEKRGGFLSQLRKFLKGSDE